MLSVSVVIPIRNAARTLPHCLGALAQLDPAPHEIILVDNGSTDESLALIRAFAEDHAARDVRVLEEPRRGAAAARNAGLRAATGHVVVFIDADCAPDSKWLCPLLAPFADPAVGAVAGRVISAPAASTVELFSALYTLQLPDQPARSKGWTPWHGGYVTANMAVRTALLKELNGFDEQSVGGAACGSDYDLCARIYARGLDIVYVPEARVMHHHRTTLQGMLRQAFDYGKSHAYLLNRKWARGLWLDVPRRPLSWEGCPVHAWLDFASADKKVLAILVLGMVYGAALWLLPLYLLWLAVVTARQAGRAGLRVAPVAAIGLAGLLLLKSSAMTWGRWSGSIRYGVLCF